MLTRLQILLFSSLLIVATTSYGAIPKPPKLAAKAYILQDFHSGKVIASKNADQRIEPASLTKMMTAYVVENELKYGNIKLTDQVKISSKARFMKGSRMFVEENSLVSVEKLLKGIIIQSGNDATVAMAEHVAGTEKAFVSLMNAYAEEMGMKNTHFVNSTGMPHRNHYTTANDMILLSKALIGEFPEHYSLYAEKEYQYNGIKQKNRNRLLWEAEFVDGIKTGHTESAGFCLAASGKKGDMRLISIVVGTRSDRARATESLKLLTYGFKYYETHRLYAANEALTKARVWKGTVEEMPLGIENDLYVTIPRGTFEKLKAKMKLDSQILAPTTEGDVYGR
ncbi:MAG: D-alanyl-D-alanine carboxypeptidase, partial [Gammaproteobacteria bacterium]|nr:D-alanyl-D-alanine carboxypeptidase [Gammaproteobacteria bacterium]